MVDTFLLEDRKGGTKGRISSMITKCSVDECKQYFDRGISGMGHTKYCDIHSEIIRQEKRKEYGRIAYLKKLESANG